MKITTAIAPSSVTTTAATAVATAVATIKQNNNHTHTKKIPKQKRVRKELCGADEKITRKMKKKTTLREKKTERKIIITIKVHSKCSSGSNKNKNFQENSCVRAFKGLYRSFTAFAAYICYNYYY